MHERLYLIDIFNLLLRLGLYDIFKDFLNFLVLLLQVLHLQQYLLVFSLELQELRGHLDIFEDFSKLHDKHVNLIDELGSGAHETAPDLQLPSLDRRRVHQVRLYGLAR